MDSIELIHVAVITRRQLLRLSPLYFGNDTFRSDLNWTELSVSLVSPTCSKRRSTYPSLTKKQLAQERSNGLFHSSWNKQPLPNADAPGDQLVVPPIASTEIKGYDASGGVNSSSLMTSSVVSRYCFPQNSHLTSISSSFWMSCWIWNRRQHAQKIGPKIKNRNKNEQKMKKKTKKSERGRREKPRSGVYQMKWNTMKCRHATDVYISTLLYRGNFFSAISFVQVIYYCTTRSGSTCAPSNSTVTLTNFREGREIVSNGLYITQV